jgi:hypothetical protein
MTQSLAVDVETLLPLRWEALDRGVEVDHGFSFDPDPSLKIARPEGVWVPNCVP